MSPPPPTPSPPTALPIPLPASLTQQFVQYESFALVDDERDRFVYGSSGSPRPLLSSPLHYGRYCYVPIDPGWMSIGRKVDQFR